METCQGNVTWQMCNKTTAGYPTPGEGNILGNAKCKAAPTGVWITHNS